MRADQHVLMTGFPGFLADNLIRRCQKTQAGLFWHLTVMPDQLALAGTRLRQLGLMASQYAIYPADITQPDIGLSPPDVQRIKDTVERCYHLAALYDLTAPPAVSDAVNVRGTRTVLELLTGCTRLRKFNYISTCYVSGTLEGSIAESALIEPPAFRNEYERTKFLAEKAVREYTHRLPTTIFRPAVVVGDSQTGETAKFDGPYVLISFLKWARYFALWMPNFGFETTKFNCVPIDFVTTVMRDVGLSDEFIGQTLQIADPAPPTTAESFETIYYQITGRRCFNISYGLKKVTLNLMHRFPLDLITGIPAQSLDYFHHRGQYRTDNLENACHRFSIRLPQWKEFYRPMVRFALAERRHAPNAAVVGEFRRWCLVFRLLYLITGLAILLFPGTVCRLLSVADGGRALNALTQDNLLYRPLAVSLLTALYVSVTTLERNPFINPLHILIIWAKMVSTVFYFTFAIYLGAVSLAICGLIDGVIALFHILFYRRLKGVRDMIGGEFQWDFFDLVFPQRFILAFSEAMTPGLEDPVDVRRVAEGVRHDVRQLPFPMRCAFLICCQFSSFILPSLYGFRPFVLMKPEHRQQFLRRVQDAPQSRSKLPLMFVKLVCSNQLFRQESYLHSIGVS